MIEQKKILAVVPARGGSKGVPLKNIRRVHDLPLIAYTAKAVTQIPEIDRAVVSTDHEETAHIAETFGLAAPFRRPQNLSGDRIGDWDVLIHALHEMERIDACSYDVILMLQPTSPRREISDVQECLRKLIREDLDSVWTVSKVDVKFHPLKQLQIQNGLMSHFVPEGKMIIARQELSETYIRNGVAYAISRDCLVKKHSILGDRASAVVVTAPLINIDTESDFLKAAAILSA